MRRIALTLAALATLAVAGCGHGSGSGPQSAGGPSPSTSPSEATSRPPSTPIPSSPTTPNSPPPATSAPLSPAAGEMTLTGTVEQGVEHGCLVMKSGGQLYLLLEGDPAVIKPSARVTVVGQPAKGLITYCQQGTPFKVRTARLA